MQRFMSACQAQRCLSGHSRIHSYFQFRRHLISVIEYRALRQPAFRVWRDVTRAATAV